MLKAKDPLPVEEIANCITHGIGLVLSVIGLVALVALASIYGGAWHIVGCTIYGVSLVMLYMASTLYHGARSPRAKSLLCLADHCCIYLLIAGTYTPFTLVTLRGAWGWTLLGLVWGLASVGVLFRILVGERFRFAAVVLYILMGWLAVIAIKPMLALIPMGGIFWIFAGGITYSFGIIFFSSKRIRHGHAIWHVFVLIGSICHYLAVLLYVLPAKS
ncbi:MAG: hemolysin III family protein [Pyrinomonadaceae bacterium]